MTVAPYKDTDVTHDHTYFGRGCSNGWGTSGEGGSQTPCVDSDAGGRYVTTYDGETQKNGTYYHYQAATSGSGGTITTDNAISRDSFCPLGWQMPYGGTGGDYYNKSRSWNYLLTTYSIGFDDGTTADATKIKSYPFSYVYSGGYHWPTGRLYFQSKNGFNWSSTIVTSARAYNLNTYASSIRPTYTDNKAKGIALRCVRIFIDGTVEGDPADLTIYIDTDPSHDLSYYGNGCNVGWGTDGSTISHTPCSTRLVTTVDDETQKNGTLYHFQAATSGTGGSMTTGHTNSPDTFCPLGWQLPYSGTGGDYYDKSRSWRYLFTTYNYNDDAQGRTGVLSYPLSYIQAGSFDGVRGGIYGQENAAYYISETNRSSTDYFRTWINNINALQVTQVITKAFQSAIRYVLEF